MPTSRPDAHEPIDTTAEVETPEHVRFHYHVAGPARRALAWLIDLMIRGAIVFAFWIVALIGGLGLDDLGRASMGFLLVVNFVIEWGYYVFFETIWSGRTPGKRAASLRVVTEGGHPLRFADSLLRNLLRAADFLPFLYAIGLVVMGRDRRFRRLGDLVAGTMVIVEERRTVADPLRIEPKPTPQELYALPLRVPLSGEELDAIELFLRRSGKLSAAREEELAAMVAPIFAKRMGLRVKDPKRLLGLLHHRAHEGRAGRSSERKA